MPCRRRGGHDIRLHRPLAAVSPGLHGQVLTVLVRTDQALTGRAVASLVQPPASHSGVQKVLDDLVLNGLVTRQSAGRANLYVLNREHLAADALTALVNLRDVLLARIRDVASNWQPPAIAVWMFGSTARDESGPHSDIDLLIVRPDTFDDADPVWLGQVDALARQISSWTGNGCEVLEFSAIELNRAVVHGERLVDELRRDAIGLYGPEPRQLLRYDRRSA